mgnify:CR=1 FL=1
MKFQLNKTRTQENRKTTPSVCRCWRNWNNSPREWTENRKQSATRNKTCLASTRTASDRPSQLKVEIWLASVLFGTINFPPPLPFSRVRRRPILFNYIPLLAILFASLESSTDTRTIPSFLPSFLSFFLSLFQTKPAEIKDAGFHQRRPIEELAFAVSFLFMSLSRGGTTRLRVAALNVVRYLRVLPLHARVYILIRELAKLVYEPLLLRSHVHRSANASEYSCARTYSQLATPISFVGTLLLSAANVYSFSVPNFWKIRQFLSCNSNKIRPFLSCNSNKIRQFLSYNSNKIR